MYKNMNKTVILNLLISILLSILYFFMLPISVSRRFPMGDTTIFEYFGYAMNKGELIYTDLFDHKGPFIFITHFIGFLIEGEQGVKLLFSIFVFISLYFIGEMARIFKCGYEYFFVPIITFFIFANFSELGLNVETLALPFITVSLFFYLRYFQTNIITNLSILIMGSSCAIVFFTRANMIGVWLFFSLLIIVTALINKKYELIFNYIFYFSLGVLIVIVPLLYYFFTNGNLYDMFYQAFYINFSYANGNMVGWYEICLWVFNQFLAYNIWLFILFSHIVTKLTKKIIFYDIIFIFVVTLSVMSKREYNHYLIAIIPFIVPYICSVISCINILIKHRINKFFLLFFSFIILFNSQLAYVKDNVKNRGYVKSEFIQLGEYLKDNTSNTDKIYAHRLNGTLYLLSERLASTKYFFIPSINSDLYFEDFKTIMESNKPRYIIYSYEYLGDSPVDSYILNYIEKNYTFDRSFDHMNVYKLNINENSTVY